MSASSPAVQEQDVYVVSAKGEEELRASGTSLSPAEIELLVRTDGRLTVAEVAAAARLATPANVAGVFGRLLERGLVRLRSRKSTGAQDAIPLQLDGTPVRPTRQALEGGKLTAIVVEDEPHLARFLKQYLALEGFETRLAGNREEILTAFATPPVPDLVLLDVVLPDADGFDVLLKMRRHPALKSVPVVMLTAKATRESVLKGLAGGADGYVTKPFEADVLIKAVQAVMGAAGGPAEKKKSGADWY
jgi:CheY-like chemotaxis protein